MIEADCAYPLGPGDAACWPAGAADAHQVVNRSDGPCTYLIFGSRMAREVIRHPDLGRIGYVEGEAWQLHRAGDGALTVEGMIEQARPLALRESEADRASWYTRHALTRRRRRRPIAGHESARRRRGGGRASGR